MKSFLATAFTVILIGTIAHAQDRGAWDFFNFRDLQEEMRNPAPSREADTIRLPDSGDVRDTRQTILPTFRSSEPFDVLVAQCAVIEGQFGRACDAERVREILATSMIFEGDAARVSDELSPDGDVTSAANTVLKGTSQADLKGYVWGLLVEDANYSKGQMHQLMKDAKMARMTNFTKSLQDSMAKWAAQKKFLETGRTTDEAGESGDDADAAAKKYGSGAQGRINYGAVTKESFPGSSCIKAIKWQLPKAGGGFGPMSAAGDTNPDSGGGTPTGPDGKPISPGEKLQGKDIDCTMFDPTFGKKNFGQSESDKAGDPSVISNKENYNQASTDKKDAQGKETTGTAIASGTAEKKEGGSSTDQHTVSGKVEQKTGSDGKVSYVFKGTVTNEKTGEEHKVQQNLPANSDGGAPKFFTTGEKFGQGWEITIDKLSGQTGGMVGMKPKGNAGYADPSADVSVASSKQKCENAANTAFKDCLFGALTKEFEKDAEQQYCEEKGWVAGEGKTGGSSIYCGPKGSAKALDQQMIFMKTGGGVTDPMMKQGGSNAAQPPQDGQFKQAQPAQ